MQMNNRKQYKLAVDVLAKPWQRILNFAIDIIMLTILLFIGLVIYLGNTITTASQGKEFMDHFMTNSTLQFMVTSVVILVYYNFFEIFTSRTVGKFCTGTIVVDQNGEKASYESVMFRSIIRIIPFYWISFIVFPIRGLHDLISKTYVVDKKKLEESKRRFYTVSDDND